MRTTVDIDADVLQAARELARRQRTSLGKLLSGLARKGLTAPPPEQAVKEPPSLYGFRPFPSRGGILTNEMIDRIREDDVY